MQRLTIFHRFALLVVPGLLTIASSLTLVSCTQQNQQAQNSATNASDINASRIKTKVLRLGYQQAGDLVRVTQVLEKRLQPLGIKVEWAQFAHSGSQLDGI